MKCFEPTANPQRKWTQHHRPEQEPGVAQEILRAPEPASHERAASTEAELLEINDDGTGDDIAEANDNESD
jgi:hypothetical protein